MPSNLLLLPLLAGFWFISFCHYFRFRSQQYEGYRLLLSSALAGLAFLAVARLITWSYTEYSFFDWMPALWRELYDQPFSGTAVLSLAIGLFAPFIVNAFLDENWAKGKILQDKTADEFFKLLHTAMLRRVPLAITMDTRKFYVGYIIRTPNLSPHETTFSILPLASGYREPKVLAFRWTTNYMNAYLSHPKTPHPRDEDLHVILPMASVKSAHIFQGDIYDRIFRPEAEKFIAQEKPQPQRN